MMMECVAVTTFVQLLEDGCEATASLNKITKSLLHKVSQELTQYITKLSAGLVLLEDILNTIQLLVKHNGGCFQQLTEIGLLELISVIFQNLLLRLARDGTSEPLQIIIELLMETVNVLADISHAAKSTVLLKLFTHFLDLLQNELLSFQTRMEVMKSANMLLEQCLTHTKECFLENADVTDKIIALVDLVKTVGDYEFQVGILEGLIRLFPRKFRQKYASQFFTDVDMLEGFLNIKDKDFEIDCRQVLNVLNSRPNLTHRVVSLPCISAFVGSKELRKPSDSGYDQFWVDFNIGSQRLTLFCEQDSILSQGEPDEELWETVAIYKSDVHRCSCSEIEGSIVLEICLKSPVCQLYPSQHQEVADNKIQIEFDLQLEANVTTATGLAFDFLEKQSKVSEVELPVQISITQVQQQDSQSSSQPVAAQVPGTPAGSVCSQESARRRKVSIPSIPMFSPLPPSRPQSATAVVPRPRSDIPLTAKQQAAAKTIQQKATDTDKSRQNTHMERSPLPEKDTISESTNSTCHSPATTESSDPTDKPQPAIQEKRRKETPKKPEFAVPKTPVSKASRPKEKVKTPVVTVAPPRKKSGKGRKKGKTRNVSEGDTNCNQPDADRDWTDVNVDSVPESQPVPESRPVPESQPVPDTVKDRRSRRDKPAKNSKPIKRVLDDSGINMDETKSSVADVSTIGADIKDANELPDPDIADLEQTRKRRPAGKKPKISSSRSASNDKIHSSADKCQSLDGITEDDPCAELNTSQKLLQLKNKTLTADENISGDANNFGFDALENEPDRIPDSLQENRLICEDPDQHVSACGDTETRKHSSVEIKRKKEKCKNSKKTKTTKETRQTAITSRSSTEMCDDNDINIIENVPSNKSQKNKKARKQFSTVNESLKELCDLDENESIKESHKAQKHETNVTKMSNKRISDSDVYDFCEPDKETCLLTENKNRQNQHKKAKSLKAKSTDLMQPVEETVKTKQNDLVKPSEKTKTRQKDLVKPVEEPLKTKPTETVEKNVKSKKAELVKPVAKERVSSRSLKSRNNQKSCKEVDEPVVASENIDSDQSSVKVIANHSKKGRGGKHISAKSNYQEENLNAEDVTISNSISSIGSSHHGPIVDETPLKLQPTTKSKSKKPKLENDNGHSSSCSEHETDFHTSKLHVDINAKKCIDFMEVSTKTKQNKQQKDNGLGQKKKLEDQTSTSRGDSDEFHEQEIMSEDNSNDSILPTIPMSQDDNSGGGMESEASSVDIEPKKHGKSGKHFQCIEKVKPKCVEKAVVTTSESESSVEKEDVHFDTVEHSDDISNVVTVAEESSQVIDEMEKGTKRKQNKTKQKSSSRTVASRSRSRKKPVKTPVYDSDTSECIDTDNTNNIGITCDIKPNKMDINKTTKTLSAYPLNVCAPKNDKRKQRKAKSKCNDNGKNLVFQMSYSKSETKFKTSNRMLSYKSMHIKEEKEYDPYDFEAQCETASMKSERLTRPDKSKVLNDLHQIKVEGQKLANRSNNPVASRSTKSGKNSKKSTDRVSFVNIDDGNDESQSVQLIHQDTNLVQDKRTNRFYRKSNIENIPVEMSEDRHEYNKEQKRQQRQKGKSKDPAPVAHISSESEIEIIRGDESDHELIESLDSSGSDAGQNNFSRIMKDIVKSRDKKTKQTGHIVKLEDELPEQCQLDISEINLTLGDLDDDDLSKTPCIGASLSSTPNQGSAKRRFYNPLNISVITPQSVSFENEEQIAEKTERNQKDKRMRGKRNTIKYKDLSDSDIEKDDGLDVSENTSAIKSGHSSLLNSSWDTTMKRYKITWRVPFYLVKPSSINESSEKSWILERKKTPKVKDLSKTYKRRNKKAFQFGASSQTEDSDDGNSQDDIAIPSLPLQSPYCSLSSSLPTGTPAFSYKSLQQDDPDDLIMTPVTPLKHSGKSRKKKDEDDIEVIQTQEDLMVSFNMDYDGKSHLDTSDVGNLCGLSQSSHGPKTPLKLTRSGGHNMPDICGKLLEEGMKTMMGDSGFASGPSSELRPSRSTLKRKYPDVESESEESSQSDMSDVEAEQSTFVPKKLFRFDHSAALQYTTSNKSMCSDVTEEQEGQEGDFPFQSGLASFMSTFGADIQKQLQAKKQRCEALTRNTLKATQKHFSNTWAEQQQYQSNVADDFQCKMMVELLALEKDISRLKEAELKSEEFFKYQLETLRQNHESQNLRVGNMKKLQASFTDRTRKVNKYNLTVHKNLQDQMRKEMVELQKKLVHETQQQELMNVRRGLQNLF